MKNLRHSAIAYERSGPLSDMFVPHAVTLARAERISRGVPVLVVAALLLVALPTLFFPGGTFSYFSDDEQSTGNTFTAGPLDFTVAPDHATSTLVAGAAGDTFTITVTPGASSLPFLYNVSGVTAGSAPFCAAITASGGAPLTYSGAASTISATSTSSLDPWSLTLTLPASSPGVVDGQICMLDLTYQAYQQGGAPGTEYHDTEHVVLTLTADPPTITPVIQTDTLPNLTENPGDATTTDATSTDPVTPPDTSSSTPADPAPADTPPPSDDTITPPPPTTDQTIGTPAADTTLTDPAPTDSPTDVPAQ